jgi:hypothetical protein
LETHQPVTGSYAAIQDRPSTRTGGCLATMRKISALLVSVLVSLILFTQASFAASNNVSITLNHAYPKSNGTYAVVVKDVPGANLALYVNDKNPVYATVNKQGWATFRGVKLSGNGKVSFGRIFHTSGKTYQKPVNYVRYFNVATDATVAFLISSPTEPTTQTTTKPIAQPVSTPTPTPTPVQQPTCTNGTYVNSEGNTVCSPEAASSAPAGATAQCVDGTYSFSQSHSGTCSHHGGVGNWL